MSINKQVMVAAAVIAAGGAVWRLVSRRTAMPCPAWLSVLVENPYFNRVAGAATLIERLELASGMAVLDAGCGPGRLTVPLAEGVGPQGKVVALDIQPEMLQRARAKVNAAGLENVEFLQAGIGEGYLPKGAFDRAILVTVLGEIPDRAAALAEIFAALKPGGILSITEVLPDPHYQRRRTSRRLAEAAGFKAGPYWGFGVGYTWLFVKLISGR